MGQEFRFLEQTVYLCVNLINYSPKVFGFIREIQIVNINNQQLTEFVPSIHAS
jgi:hypothetical protein